MAESPDYAGHLAFHASSRTGLFHRVPPTLQHIYGQVIGHCALVACVAIARLVRNGRHAYHADVFDSPVPPVNLTESLQRLASGLEERYQLAEQPLPQLLYADRDCWSRAGPSTFKVSVEVIY